MSSKREIREQSGEKGLQDREFQSPLMEVAWKISEKENCMAGESVALVDAPVLHGKKKDASSKYYQLRKLSRGPSQRKG